MNIPINFDQSIEISDDAKDLIIRLLNPNESARIDLKELDVNSC